jgi:hypothetical protein
VTTLYLEKKTVVVEKIGIAVQMEGGKSHHFGSPDGEQKKPTQEPSAMRK